MIDRTELRIGNLVIDDKGDTVRICGVKEDNKCDIEIFPLEEHWRWWEIDPDYLEPIPISPEWLERLGFEERHPRPYSYKDAYCIGTLIWSERRLFKATLTSFVQLTDNNFMPSHEPLVMYVHQLQNVFYSLTGKELEFEDFKKEGK
jgi:hypothetical protein